MKKYLLLTALFYFYFLALLQSSFLVHFTVFGAIPNLILLSVISMAFIEKPRNQFSIASAFFGGIFLDIFSGSAVIGFNAVAFVLLIISIKFIFTRYVQSPNIPKI